MGLAVGVFALRVVFLAFFSPYDLVADEAFYWEWSMRPALSYYTKGPGVAWTIWLGTKVFGVTEFGVRIGAAVSGLVAMLAMGGMATRAAGDTRVGFVAAAAFALVSGYQAVNVLMTIDGPYVAGWIFAAWAALVMFERGRGASERSGKTLGPALALGAACGIAFLYKYTILLLLPGVVWHALVLQRQGRWSGGWLIPGAAFLVAFTVTSSPVWIWNYQQGWPTVKHLLGHLHVAGGDVESKPWVYNPVWTLEYVGSQLGIAGPLLVLGIVQAGRWAVARPEADPRWPALALMFRIGAPIFVFYAAVTAKTDVEGNWPIAGFSTLLVPLAVWVVDAHDGWTGDERPGAVRLWRWIVGYGLVSALVLHALIPLTAQIPGIDKITPMYRLKGQQAFADAVQAAREKWTDHTQDPPAVPLVVTDHYGKAALLRFYLPGHPVTYCASKWRGSRHTGYDDFEDTRLDAPALTGRRAILVGGDRARWEQAFAFPDIQHAGWMPYRRGKRELFTGVFPPPEERPGDPQRTAGGPR